MLKVSNQSLKADLSEASCWILDFDGTVAMADVGDALCERFADPSWLEVDHAWERGELSLPDAQRQMWQLIQATESELLAYANEIGGFRPGFEDWLEFGIARMVPMVLASGGFDFYIKSILGSRLLAFEACYYNSGRPNGINVDVDFPNRDDVGCARCAVCKGKVCQRYQEKYGPVLFVGDGASDRCAVGVADYIVAVTDSKLAQYCHDAGVDVIEFSAFSDLQSLMDG